jgi:hypothetical protein
MPLIPFPIATNVITKAQGGTAVTLNRAQYPDLARVEGEPTISLKHPAFDAAIREAFAALSIARKLTAMGARQRIFLGDEAVRLVYGGAKGKDEKDCDVVGYGLSGKDYGYWLAEGKGDDLEKAIAQFEAVRPRLETRRPDPANPKDPGPGLICGAMIVTNRLRYLQWNNQRRAWVALNGAIELAEISSRLKQDIDRAKPTLQADKVYLLDGPEAPDRLPLWAITPAVPPWTVLIHQRSSGDRGQFRPLRLGAGTLELFFVAS